LQITTQMLIFIFLAYWILIYWLKRKGVLAKYNMSAFGPILTIETSKGLYLLDKIALPKRFWRLFANIGIILMFAGMIFMFSLVVFSDITLIRSILAGNVMEPNDLTKIQNIFLIPGNQSIHSVCLGTRRIDYCRFHSRNDALGFSTRRRRPRSFRRHYRRAFPDRRFCQN
jgi:hypothetical protein